MQLTICSPYRHETFLHVYAILCSLVFNKNVFMKLVTFFISSTGRIFTKPLPFSEISIKIKVRSYGTLFVILLTSAVICKQRPMRGIKIVQYLQNCKCYNVSQDHFRKSL